MLLRKWKASLLKEKAFTITEEFEDIPEELKPPESAADEFNQQLLSEIETVKQEVLNIHKPREEADSFKIELLGEIDQLRSEINKLGKTHLRASAIAEADRDILKENSQQLLTLVQCQDEGETPKFDPTLIVKDLLPIADGLEEGIKAGENLKIPRGSFPIDTGINGWIDGVRIVCRRVLDLLKKWDVRQMEAIGETFNPHLHIAVGVEHTSEFPENTIIAEQRKGYLLGNEVIRYAEVIVAKAEKTEAAEEKPVKPEAQPSISKPGSWRRRDDFID